MDYVVEAEDPTDGSTVIFIVKTESEALSQSLTLKREGHTNVRVLDPGGTELAIGL